MQLLITTTGWFLREVLRNGYRVSGWLWLMLLWLLLIVSPSRAQQTVFYPRLLLAVDSDSSNGTNEMKTGDMNADGIQDIIFIEYPGYGSRSYWIEYLNNAPILHELPFIRSSRWDIADFNSDGYDDIITTLDSGGDTTAYEINLNEMDNQWSSHRIFETTATTTWGTVGIGDVDNDNDFDIITDGANDLGRNYIWLENDGSFTSTWQVHYVNVNHRPLNAWIKGVGDFDGNGQSDFIALEIDYWWSYYHYVTYFQTGNNWIEIPLYSNYDSEVALADFDNDSTTDIMVLGDNIYASSYDRYVSGLVWSSYESNQWEHYEVNINTDNFGVRNIADCDNDGDSDVIIYKFAPHPNGTSEFLWLENRENPTHVRKHLVDRFPRSSRSIQTILTLDLDGDGDTDFVTSEYSNGYDLLMFYENRPAPVIDISLQPLNPPVIIPDSGGTFGFDLTFSSDVVEPLDDCSIWIEVVFPDGDIRRMGNYGLTLRPDITLSFENVDVSVPADAPAGNYEFRIVGGRLQYDRWGEAAFAVTKLGQSTTANNRSDWLVEGIVSEYFSPSQSADLQDETIELPVEYSVHAAYPNPFNSTTTVTITLPSATQLKVMVLNVMGQQVAAIANGSYNAGTHTLTFDASGLVSGLYFIRAIVPGQINQTQKVMLVK